MYNQKLKNNKRKEIFDLSYLKNLIFKNLQKFHFLRTFEISVCNEAAFILLISFLNSLNSESFLNLSIIIFGYEQ